MTARSFGAPLSAMLISAFLTMAVSTSAQATALPLIVSATVDYTNKTLTITGQNFGTSPIITMDSLTFPTLSSSSNQIVGNFPSDRSPSSFAPGTYFLTLQFRNQVPAVFTVDIGANGTPGPIGPQGIQGPQGVAGTNGANGKDGGVGPAGPAGKDGGVGPAGPAGKDGGVGPTGPAGRDGTNGTNGVSVTSTALPIGDPNCPNGGSSFASASGTTYGCNGATPAAEGWHMVGGNGEPSFAGWTGTYLAQPYASPAN